MFINLPSHEVSNSLIVRARDWSRSVPRPKHLLESVHSVTLMPNYFSLVDLVNEMPVGEGEEKITPMPG